MEKNETNDFMHIFQYNQIICAVHTSFDSDQSKPGHEIFVYR